MRTHKFNLNEKNELYVSLELYNKSRQAVSNKTILGLTVISIVVELYLNDEERKLYNLRFIQNLKIKEIAELYNLSESNVSRRLKRIKKIINHYYDFSQVLLKKMKRDDD